MPHSARRRENVVNGTAGRHNRSPSVCHHRQLPIERRSIAGVRRRRRARGQGPDRRGDDADDDDRRSVIRVRAWSDGGHDDPRTPTHERRSVTNTDPIRRPHCPFLAKHSSVQGVSVHDWPPPGEATGHENRRAGSPLRVERAAALAGPGAAARSVNQPPSRDDRFRRGAAAPGPSRRPQGARPAFVVARNPRLRYCHGPIQRDRVTRSLNRRPGGNLSQIAELLPLHPGAFLDRVVLRGLPRLGRDEAFGWPAAGRDRRAAAIPAHDLDVNGPSDEAPQVGFCAPDRDRTGSAFPRACPEQQPDRAIHRRPRAAQSQTGQVDTREVADSGDFDACRADEHRAAERPVGSSLPWQPWQRAKRPRSPHRPRPDRATERYIPSLNRAFIAAFQRSSWSASSNGWARWRSIAGCNRTVARGMTTP